MIGKNRITEKGAYIGMPNREGGTSQGEVIF